MSPHDQNTVSAEEVREAASRLTMLISNYNHGRFLPAVFDSLEAQTLMPHCVWVYDDGSTDNSREIIARYAERLPALRPIYLPQNRGLFANFEEFLTETNTEFLYFGAADDVLHPDLFRRSLEMLLLHPAAGLCSAMTRLIDENGEDIGALKSVRPWNRPHFVGPQEAAGQLMKDQPWFVGNTTIYRRDAVIAAGGFDHELRSATDSFTSQVIVLRHGACFIPEYLGYWRRMREGFSSSVMADPGAAVSVATHARKLINGKFASLFPPGYDERWCNRWIYAALRSAPAQDPTIAARVAARLAPPRTRTEAALLALASRTPGLSRLLLSCYAALRLRRDDLPTILRRKIRFVFYGRTK